MEQQYGTCFLEDDAHHTSTGMTVTMTDLIVWSTMCTGEDWAWRQLCWLRELSHRVQTFSGILADINSSTFTAVNMTAKIHVNKPQYCETSGSQPPFRQSISSKMVEAVWVSKSLNGVDESIKTARSQRKKWTFFFRCESSSCGRALQTSGEGSNSG